MAETGIATGLNSIYRELHKFERGLRPYQNNIQQTMKIFLKILLILGGIGFVIFVGFMGIMIAAFRGFDKDYSISELKENFEEKKAEIYELKNYINKIIPPDKSVEIEFENNNTLGIFHVKVGDNFDSNWDVKISSGKADTFEKIFSGRRPINLFVSEITATK